MINVTKLNGSRLVINADLVEFIESTPDTLLTLTTGRKVMVKEDMESVVQRIVDYRRLSCSHPVPVGGPDNVFDSNKS
ncbi:flagellar FlbD family protein [bacterium]|nr:flagellar FlbD family protein [bacterium]MBU1072835.1 flagellar FlbD family protein [bacterium]MBU1674555.1 flagellar FlbD family protein [bacterium]